MNEKFSSLKELLLPPNTVIEVADSNFNRLSFDLLWYVCSFLDLQSLSKLSGTSQGCRKLVNNAFENSETKESINAIKTFVRLREKFLDDSQCMSIRHASVVVLRISFVAFIFGMFKMMITCDDKNPCLSSVDNIAIQATALFGIFLSLIGLFHKKQLTQEEASAVLKVLGITDESLEREDIYRLLRSRIFRDVEGVFKDPELQERSNSNIENMKNDIAGKVSSFFQRKELIKRRTNALIRHIARP